MTTKRLPLRYGRARHGGKKGKKAEACVVDGCRNRASEVVLPCRFARFLPIKGVKANVCPEHEARVTAQIDAEIVESLVGYA